MKHTVALLKVFQLLAPGEGQKATDAGLLKRSPGTEFFPP